MSTNPLHDIRELLQKQIDEMKQYMRYMKRADIKDRDEKHKIRLEIVRRHNALNDLDNGRLYHTPTPDGGFMIGRYIEEDVAPVIQRRLESISKPHRYTINTTNVDENAGSETASHREDGDGVQPGENGQAESASAGESGGQC